MGSGELCADIRRRVGDGRQVPLKYMNLVSGFRLQVDECTERLVLLRTSDPTMREEVGYQEYDNRLPGMRWYLNPSWRSDVTFLLSRLGMLETVSEDAIPF
jgi:hypothetical protein